MRIKVATLSDLNENQGHCVRARENKIALFKSGGKVYAIANECPHRNGPLSEGMVYENIVICPWHGWQFDITTGLTTMGGEGVQSYPVEIENENVYILLNQKDN